MSCKVQLVSDLTPSVPFASQEHNKGINEGILVPPSPSCPAPDSQLPRRLDLAEAGYLGRVSRGLRVDTFFVMSECTLTGDKKRGRPRGKCLISRL